jgi:hypothetical protein
MYDLMASISNTMAHLITSNDPNGGAEKDS